MGKVIKYGGVVLATGVVAGVTAGCVHSMATTPTVSVFCRSFEPIEMPEGDDYHEVRIALAGHNAVYEKLCDRRSVWRKAKDSLLGD